MGTPSSAESLKEGDSSEYFSHSTVSPLPLFGEKLEKIRTADNECLIKLCVVGEGGTFDSVCFLMCVHICAWKWAIIDNFRSRACESEWWRFGSGYCVYCNQMWTGMWRAGMQWLVSVSHPSFSLLCPLSPPHASFYPAPSCCPSDLLFRLSVRLWLLALFSFAKSNIMFSLGSTCSPFLHLNIWSLNSGSELLVL